MKVSLQYVLDNTIYLARHGSHAHGLAIETSDLDIRGIFVAGPKFHIGYNKTEQFQDFEGDEVRYEIKKFVNLAAACNPSILEILFVDPSDVLEVTKVGEILLAERETFVTLKAKHTYTGYANAQLKKIRAKYRWITNPPEEPPKQEDYYREPRNEIEMKLLKKGSKIYDKEAYQKARLDWKNYQHWLTDRNPARKELEDKYGYDTKHAMHLFRLLRMGQEICTTGKVNVKRPDREELLGIRRGALTYDELVNWADTITREIDELYEDYKSGRKEAPIPMNIQQEKLNPLVIRLLEEQWRMKGWLKGELVNA